MPAESGPRSIAPIHTAAFDSSLSARVVRCVPMTHADGASADEDRPTFVRAASGAAWHRDGLVVVQDDANFVAVVAPETGLARAIPLPRGHQGKRLFDEGRGNKRWKLDLESCAVVSSRDGAILLAFGSGSTSERRRIAVGPADDLTGVRLVPADRLYAALESATQFSGSQLNLEGIAALPANRLRLFQRGNGARVDGIDPVNATADVEIDALLRYLAEPEHAPIPPLADIARWELGVIGNARLTFTDAVWSGDELLFAAAAEDSPDTYRDGPVSGAAIGVFAADGQSARWARVTADDGSAWLAKPEGIVPGRRPGTVLLVVDRDDPETPAALCEVELSGPWT